MLFTERSAVCSREGTVADPEQFAQSDMQARREKCKVAEHVVQVDAAVEDVVAVGLPQ